MCDYTLFLNQRPADEPEAGGNSQMFSQIAAAALELSAFCHPGTFRCH